ncbi:hypothetical protein [Halorussus caseinilyticus]|uniref:Uncharacterized protein n=1 Tax=Halorussus caseinilyticus TaxID=3034025 RepID=A0ABD5WHS8_9EURY|nr:hypothetical protein [Halorussus sp. DT72]
MRDIVAQALESAAETREDAEDADDDRDPEAFGPPQFALVGCGEAGIDRANVGVQSPSRDRYSFEFDVTTVAVGAPSSLDSDRADVCVPVETDDRSAVESSDLSADDAALESRLETVDVAVVTAHLSAPETAELTAAAADCLPSDATVVAAVSVPESVPATDRFSAGFERVAGAADTVVPLDFAHLRSGFDAAFEDSTDADDPPVRSLADGLVRELTTDCFEVIQAPLSAPVNVVRLYDLLDTGGIALAYRGVGTRDDVAAELLDHAVAHRLCDGDRSTADGGLGVCRFGEAFTLREYQDLFGTAADRFGTAVEPDRWVHAGNATTGLGEECRVTILLTGVEPSSLRFFDLADDGAGAERPPETYR